MTKEELKQKIAEIDRAAKLQKKAVYEAFVEQNATYKVGDIVGNASGTIRVESISYYVFHGDVSIFYMAQC